LLTFFNDTYYGVKRTMSQGKLLMQTFISLVTVGL